MKAFLPSARGLATARMRPVAWSALSLGVALVIGCAPHYQHSAARSLASSDGLMCTGYLVWNREPVRDVFLVVNGSGTLSNAFVNPTFEPVLNTSPVGYATFDKPGVRAPFGDPAALRRDDAVLQRYTLGDGISCATEALRWARAQFGPAVRLHLRGHSEGTLIALYTYGDLLDSDPTLAAQIDTLVLSGLALEPFADIVDRQLAAIPDGPRVRQALASCDWAVLEKSMGISCAYIEDAVRRPSGRAMFERLATRMPPVRFHVFQGTEWRRSWRSAAFRSRWARSSRAADGGVRPVGRRERELVLMGRCSAASGSSAHHVTS